MTKKFKSSKTCKQHMHCGESLSMCTCNEVSRLHMDFEINRSDGQTDRQTDRKMNRELTNVVSQNSKERVGGEIQLGKKTLVLQHF